EDEARALYEEFPVPGAGRPLFQAASANFQPGSEASVDSQNPQRGPMKLLSGELDHTVPWAIANASFKKQQRNPSFTAIEEIPGRGHSLVIDHGWEQVAAIALSFIDSHRVS
ncbi:MAG: alpha/beta hydrolase, partial [Frankiales bacterium]|nr:alpha/beta hydrolase [Frankiales bacterium]